jgi:hypothetical protein
LKEQLHQIFRRHLVRFAVRRRHQVVDQDEEVLPQNQDEQIQDAVLSSDHDHRAVENFQQV